MTLIALSSLLVVAAATFGVSAQDIGDPGFVPLAEKRFTYPDGIPYQVDPASGTRGSQYGYNICNSTTEGPTSRCQTAFINSIDDWCIWGPPDPNSTIGATEGEAVAYCTKPGRGTRLMPKDSITGVQFLRAPAYIEAIVFFDQRAINIQPDDYGGEMDPHGADLRGNPLGGLVFSNALPQSSTGNNTFLQAVEWHNFVGSNHSCFKACDPRDPHAADFCEHRFDRIGVAYTCPNRARNGVFEVCDSENQDFPGIYTLPDGTTTTYTQPPESLGVITTMPYTARVPASSNCVTFQSTDLFPALPTGTFLPSSSSSAAASTGAASGSAATRTGTAGSASNTPSPTGAVTGGAGSLHCSVFATLAGVIFATIFFS